MFTVGGEPAGAASANGAKPAAKKSNPELPELEMIDDGAGQATATTEEADPFGNLDTPAEPEPPRPKKKQPSSENGDAPRKKDAAERTRETPGRKKLKKKEKDPPPIGAAVLGVFALILGVAALIVGPKDLIGLASVPVAFLGLMLGVGGLVTAWGRPSFLILVPIVGLLVSLAAVPVGGYHTYQLFASGKLTASADDVAKNSTNPSDPTKPLPGSTDPVRQPSTQPQQPPPPPPPPPDQWVDAKQGYPLAGKVLVKVTTVDVEQVKSLDGKETSPNRQLVLRLEIKNIGNKDFDYFAWGVTPPQGDGAWPQLLDDGSTPIKRFAFEGTAVAGQLRAETVTPGKAVNDLLVFDVPPDSTKFLRLELSGSNVGETGKLKLEIPVGMLGAFVKKGIDPKPKDPVGGPPNPKVWKFIEEQRVLLKRPKAPERIEALNQIGALGADGVRAVGDVAQILATDKDPHVRAAAAEALGNMGPGARGGIMALMGGLKHEFWKVKANSAKALGQMGPVAKEALPLLRELTKSKDEEVPQRAAEAIKKIEGK
ncbi:MAG: HEAT repeat domain-containing protein [Gemmataceae bacterium]|nr:HEAT repeat domain-containing protein [Gemmataceae bacterium]